MNGDAYIDEYDLFVKQFDTNKDGAISQGRVHQPDAPASSTTPNLFARSTRLAPPLFNEDKNGNGFLDVGEDMQRQRQARRRTRRAGYKDGVHRQPRRLREDHAGRSLLATDRRPPGRQNSSRPARRSTTTIQGPIAPTETGQTPVKFGAAATTCSTWTRRTSSRRRTLPQQDRPDGGTTVRQVGRIENTTWWPPTRRTRSPYVNVTAAGDTSLVARRRHPRRTFDAANAAAVDRQEGDRHRTPTAARSTSTCPSARPS